MTLRVTFEIIPFGEEDRKYEIGTLNIHNGGDHGLGYCEYYGEMKKKMWGDKVETKKFDKLMHSRQEGFAVLVEKVLKELNDQ